MGWRCTYATDSNVCSTTLEFEWDIQGFVLLLQGKCSDNHFGHSGSGGILCTRGNNKVYFLSVMLGASALFSGNNYAKIKRLIQNSYHMPYSVRHNVCLVHLQLKIVGKRCGRKSWKSWRITQNYVYVVMSTMILGDIAQSRLIYFLPPRGYCRYEGPLCDKKSKTIDLMFQIFGKRVQLLHPINLWNISC